MIRAAVPGPDARTTRVARARGALEAPGDRRARGPEGADRPGAIGRGRRPRKDEQHDLGDERSRGDCCGHRRHGGVGGTLGLERAGSAQARRVVCEACFAGLSCSASSARTPKYVASPRATTPAAPTVSIGRTSPGRAAWSVSGATVASTVPLPAGTSTVLVEATYPGVRAQRVRARIDGAGERRAPRRPGGRRRARPRAPTAARPEREVHGEPHELRSDGRELLLGERSPVLPAVAHRHCTRRVERRPRAGELSLALEAHPEQQRGSAGGVQPLALAELAARGVDLGRPRAGPGRSVKSCSATIFDGASARAGHAHVAATAIAAAPASPSPNGEAIEASAP